jgi:hypothetical protein
VTLVPPATLKLDLRKDAAAITPKPTPSRPPVSSSAAGGRLAAAGKAAAKKDLVASGSWWAARAKAGEVTGGFSRDEILRPAKEDPRSEGGLFSRVSGLLRELSAGQSIG